MDTSNLAFPKPKDKNKIDKTKYKGINKVSKHKEQVKKSTYDAVMKNCNNRCVLCGKQTSLELHHVLGRSINTNNVKTCVMLCINCHHNVVHKNNKKFRMILLDILKIIAT